MKQKLGELAQKAKLHKAPDVCISKNERFASVNVFQKRISVGEYLLSLWKKGKFSDEDVEATLAHEVGHLMDFRRDSRSSSFRNLLVESLWFSFGIVPLILYLLAPTTFSFVLSAAVALCWGASIPFIVRHVEVRIEFEADQNAAALLVAPEQLAHALVKISSFAVPSKTLGFTARLSFLAGTLTHPSFAERVRNLQSR
jgi:Zn-dependent protease with chaperone function